MAPSIPYRPLVLRGGGLQHIITLQPDDGSPGGAVNQIGKIFEIGFSQNNGNLSDIAPGDLIFDPDYHFCGVVAIIDKNHSIITAMLFTQCDLDGTTARFYRFST